MPHPDKAISTPTRQIHPTAIIEPTVQLDEGVIVGPYCHISGHVQIGRGTVLHSHVVITGFTTIGADCQIFPFASIGHAPQDKKFQGEESRLVIGNNNVIREYVTMQPGTRADRMVTEIGDHNLFMATTHVAHDCVIGNHCILANSAALAGHVVLEDYVILGGHSGVRQFARIGAHAMIGAMTGVEQDVMPYALVLGNRARMAGVNIVGLKRRGFSNQAIQEIRRVYDALFQDNQEMLLQDRLKMLQDEGRIETPEAQSMLTFMQRDSKLGFCQAIRA